jgi:glycine cleavage system P protein (glycine dehydrogenase) subunit 1
MKYTPHTTDEVDEMLRTIGANSIEDLFKSIPPEARCNGKLDLPEGLPEADLMAHMSEIAGRNRTLSSGPSFAGAGAYRHYVPAAVTELSSRSEFVTPYTPYQPEVSQGTLQALFEYQSQICRLFSMDVSNASHYSAATAAADAALMTIRASRGKRTQVLVADTLHPEYREVISTTLENENVTVIPSDDGILNRAALSDALSDNVACVIVGYPNFFGIVEDFQDVSDTVHRAGALFIAAVPEPLALGVVRAPGDWGADIAVGEGLSLGLSTSFGGPTLGIFTVTNKLVRNMPGRVCGRTTDAQGRNGYVLTLATREQHIRRERATSNICSNQALCATTASIYMSLMGKYGIRKLSEINAAKSAYAREKLSKIPSFSARFDAPFFNEFVLDCPDNASDILKKLAERNVLGGVALSRWYPEMQNSLLICTTEMNSKNDIDALAEALAGI